MSPIQILRAIHQALRTRSRNEFCADLRDALDNGADAPDWSAYPGAASYFHAYQDCH